MSKSRTENRVSKIPIEKLVDHPDNPNRMSKGNFAGWFATSSGRAGTSR